MSAIKKYFLLSLLLISFSGYAQNTINNYKYVLVPEKFSFLKQENQYNLNALTKKLLEDKGFTVYYDNTDLPEEIANNKCKALTLDILGKSTMFSTNLTLLLKDCKGAVLFKGKEGKSREKEYDISYTNALREAFTSLNDLSYAYTPAANVQEEVKTVTVTVTPPPPPVQTLGKTVTMEKVEINGTLYAQATANGYQLIDTSPKIVFTLLKTSTPDYFIATNGNVNGIVFKKNENWFFDYYKNDQLVSEKLSVKF